MNCGGDNEQQHHLIVIFDKNIVSLPAPPTHLLVTPSRDILIIPGGNSRRCLHLNLLRLDLNISSSWSVRRILQRSDLGADGL